MEILPPSWVFLCASHLRTGPPQPSAEGKQHEVKETLAGESFTAKKRANAREGRGAVPASVCRWQQRDFNETDR